MSGKDDIMVSMTIELRRDGRITVTKVGRAEIDPSIATTLLFGMLKSAEFVIEKRSNREITHEMIPDGGVLAPIDKIGGKA